MHIGALLYRAKENNFYNSTSFHAALGDFAIYFDATS